MKKLIFYSLATAFLLSLLFMVNHSFACGHEKVNWEYKGLRVSQYDPELKQYTWETSRPPYGPFDKISLYRFVRQRPHWDEYPYRPSKDPRKVLFIIGGTWDPGFPKGTNPYVSEPWFFAAKGYDVYTIGFRTSYIKPNLAYSQFPEFGLTDALKGTADWTYGQFREDIKACIELAKKNFRCQKIILSWPQQRWYSNVYLCCQILEGRS